MQVDKFYLDVVDRDGGGCIGYALQLDRFRVAATLRWRPDGTAAHQRRTLRGTLPDLGSAAITWHCAPLALEGTWAGRQAAVAETTLWANGDGAVRWSLLAPAATVEMRLGDELISGRGYVERLRLDLAPWRLPIDTLRWGRFASAAHSVVWIEWIHDGPRRWLWHNGVACVPVALDHAAIAWPGWRLEIGAGRTLRAGRLADTAFARWPGLRQWLPRRIRAFDETKWCAPGTLSEAGGSRTEGWVIHERVELR